jgi:GDPmannose 4,6-dehydratase
MQSDPNGRAARRGAPAPSRAGIGYALVASTALITGIAGQDGTYLSELLLDLGYRVHGFDNNAEALARLEALMRGRDDRSRLTLYPPLDVGDAAEVRKLVEHVRPDELYNLAAQSRVDVSYREPARTFDSIVTGTANVLEAVRRSGLPCRVFQASSSEMFGNAPAPQRENTEFRPLSPYACAKMLAHEWARHCRETYGMHISAGIMFNHESPRRSVDFVTRRITSGVALIRAGKLDKLTLGNMDSRRDWGHARDFVRAMHLMLQQPAAADYVIATGTSHSVRDFAELAFSRAGLHWQEYVVRDDPSRLRPADPHDLCGNATRIQQLGWKPEADLSDIVHEMLAEDLRSCGIDPAGPAPADGSMDQTSSMRVGVSKSSFE